MAFEKIHITKFFQCTVRVSVSGFSEKVSKNLVDSHLLPEISEGSLTDARDIQVYMLLVCEVICHLAFAFIGHICFFSLQLVSLLRIVPESVLLYFNPEAKVVLFHFTFVLH